MKKQTKIFKRRRREGKTNYSKRLKILKGSHPRLVVRKTNRYLILQIVISKNAQDSVVKGITTKELLKFGWPEENRGSLKSIPASYLGGFLLGKMMKNFEEMVILDMGLHPNTKHSRIYAAVKGLSDAGLKINYSEEVIPSPEKIEGKYSKITKDIFNKIKKSIEERIK